MARRTAKALVVTALLAAVALAAVSAAEAASTRKLRALKVDPRNSGDKIYNYDFNSARRSRRNVDWGVNLLFFNDAEIDKVKAALALGVPGSRQNARMKDDGSWFWDEDGGRKGTACPRGTRTTHYRVYADRPGGDRNYSRGLGFYVIGTTHRDVNECGGGTRYFGDTEIAERDIFALGASAPGWQAWRNNYNMRNRERRRREGDHRWRSNGLATMFQVP